MPTADKNAPRLLKRGTRLAGYFGDVVGVLWNLGAPSRVLNTKDKVCNRD